MPHAKDPPPKFPKPDEPVLACHCLTGPNLGLRRATLKQLEGHAIRAHRLVSDHMAEEDGICSLAAPRAFATMLVLSSLTAASMLWQTHHRKLSKRKLEAECHALVEAAFMECEQRIGGHEEIFVMDEPIPEPARAGRGRTKE